MARPYLRSGRLAPVLTDWQLASADIFAVYPERLNMSAKVTAFIEFLRLRFAHHGERGEEGELVW